MKDIREDMRRIIARMIDSFINEKMFLEYEFWNDLAEYFTHE